MKYTNYNGKMVRIISKKIIGIVIKAGHGFYTVKSKDSIYYARQKDIVLYNHNLDLLYDAIIYYENTNHTYQYDDASSF